MEEKFEKISLLVLNFHLSSSSSFPKSYWTLLVSSTWEQQQKAAPHFSFGSEWAAGSWSWGHQHRGFQRLTRWLRKQIPWVTWAEVRADNEDGVLEQSWNISWQQKQETGKQNIWPGV